jgi:hypothetical protein
VANRLTVIGKQRAFCSGGVPAAEGPSTVRTPLLQPTDRTPRVPVEARIYGKEIAREERGKYLPYFKASRLAPKLMW